ncbi:MAG: ribosome maturation factor RimP [Burkholderiales bacterium]|nr:ribosome maturation factor RimP [Burkholderiales bacterium]
MNDCARFPTALTRKWANAHFFLVTTDTHTLLADTLAAHGYELIDAEFVRARKLWRVFIDLPGSRFGVDLIGLDACAAMSEPLQDALIAAGVDYEHLEVSSPGLDRALTRLDHFRRFAGATVKLTLAPPFNGVRSVVGTLIGVQSDCVVVDASPSPLPIPYANVARARVVPQFPVEKT